MDGRSASRLRSRGGEGIQAPRPHRARLATGAAAVVAAVGLASVPVLHDLHLWLLVVGFALLAMVLLLGGLALGWASPVGWGLALLGAEYAVFFTDTGRSLDELTPAYSAWFVLVAELAYWSLEPRVAAWTKPSLLVRRLSQMGMTCAGAAVLAALVLVVAGASGGGGIALEVLGAVAAVGALGVVAALARSKSLG